MIHPGTGSWPSARTSRRRSTTPGFTFVGPSAAGDRDHGRQGGRAPGGRPRRRADRPGTPEPVDIRQAKKQAERVGFPLLVKAAFGGGGKGMHVVRDADHLDEALRRAAREAQSYFGRPEVFLERYVDRAHHVEAQVIADTTGNVFFLGERDCSRPAPPSEADRGDALARRWTRRCATQVRARPRSRSRRSRATSTPARSNASSTRTARSTSWR